MKLKGPVYPNPAKPDDAWFYEDMNSIDVYIATKGGYEGCVSVRIPRRLLANWIKRTERK